MDSQAPESAYARTVLDARGFASPSGGGRRHFWAVSGFEIADGTTIISVVATCFDSAIWVGRCMAAEVVAQLAEDLGVVLTERELVEFIQEALSSATAATTNNHQLNPAAPLSQPQPLPPKLSQPVASQRMPPPANGGGGSQPLTPHPHQTQKAKALSQQPQSQAQLPPQQPQQQPALVLHLPDASPAEPGADRGCGEDGEVAPAGVSGGGGGGGAGGDAADPDSGGGGCGGIGIGVGGERGAFVSVTLPRSRFDGSEVIVRLPSRGGTVRVSGREAQNACLTLVANLCQQFDEQRDELDSLVSELSRAAEENRLLRAQLAAAAGDGGGGGGGAGGLTFRDQYGLAGAPQPAPGGGAAAAAKRPRNGASVPGGLLQLQLQMQLQAAAAGGGGGSQFAAALSQPLSQAQPLTQSEPALLPQPSQGGGGGAWPRLVTQSIAAAAAAGGEAAAGRLAAAGGAATQRGDRADGPIGRALSASAPPGSTQQQSQQQQQPVGDGGGGAREAEPPVHRDPTRVGVTIRKTSAAGRGSLGRGGRGPPRR